MAAAILTSLHGRVLGLTSAGALCALHGMDSPPDQTAGARHVATGSWKPLAATDGTDTTPATTETYIAEFFIPLRTLITGVALMNGSAVAGNIFVGLARSDGSLVVDPVTGVALTSGAVAQSGTAAYQRIPFSNTINLRGPENYYLLVQCSSTSARFRSHTVGNFGAAKKTGETNGTFTAITAPTTFTTALAPIASLY